MNPTLKVKKIDVGSVNLQLGSNNMQFNGPVQINAEPTRKIDEWCNRCGKPIQRGEYAYREFIGALCRSCLDLAKAQIAERRHALLMDSNINMIAAPADESIPLQIAEPQSVVLEPVRRTVWVRDDPRKYAHLPKPYHVPLVEVTTENQPNFDEDMPY